ncbi:MULTISPECIES: hypothetical protein [unclassified Nostoc]|nr:hypothetical protein [Nostoc sp. DedQUE03]MDZ7977540.1 hypothetical protein [Nostoc sp. DedQUE03]MDZ8046430.1 hypothetical protein [Nostoc sp. DedQUE02]
MRLSDLKSQIYKFSVSDRKKIADCDRLVQYQTTHAEVLPT